MLDNEQLLEQQMSGSTKVASAGGGNDFVRAAMDAAEIALGSNQVYSVKSLISNSELFPPITNKQNTLQIANEWKQKNNGNGGNGSAGGVASIALRSESVKSLTLGKQHSSKLNHGAQSVTQSKSKAVPFTTTTRSKHIGFLSGGAMIGGGSSGLPGATITAGGRSEAKINTRATFTSKKTLPVNLMPTTMMDALTSELTPNRGGLGSLKNLNSSELHSGGL